MPDPPGAAGLRWTAPLWRVSGGRARARPGRLPRPGSSLTRQDGPAGRGAGMFVGGCRRVVPGDIPSHPARGPAFRTARAEGDVESSMVEGGDPSGGCGIRLKLECSARDDVLRVDGPRPAGQGRRVTAATCRPSESLSAHCFRDASSKATPPCRWGGQSNSRLFRSVPNLAGSCELPRGVEPLSHPRPESSEGWGWGGPPPPPDRLSRRRGGRVLVSSSGLGGVVRATRRRRWPVPGDVVSESSKFKPITCSCSRVALRPFHDWQDLRAVAPRGAQSLLARAA